MEGSAVGEVLPHQEQDFKLDHKAPSHLGPEAISLSQTSFGLLFFLLTLQKVPLATQGAGFKRSAAGGSGCCLTCDMVVRALYLEVRDENSNLIWAKGS